MGVLDLSTAAAAVGRASGAPSEMSSLGLVLAGGYWNFLSASQRAWVGVELGKTGLRAGLAPRLCLWDAERPSGQVCVAGPFWPSTSAALEASLSRKSWRGSWDGEGPSVSAGGFGPLVRG